MRDLTSQQASVLHFLQLHYSVYGLEVSPPDPWVLADTCASTIEDALAAERFLKDRGFIPFLTPRRPILAVIDGERV